MHRWYGREQNNPPFFPNGGLMVVVRNVSICVEDIFCFMAVYWEMPASAVVRALGLGYSPSLSTSCLSTWAGDTTPDIVFKSSHRKLVKRQYDFVFFLLPLVSFCSYIHVYDLALCSYDITVSGCSINTHMFSYCITSIEDIITRHNTDHVIAL